MVRIMRSKSVRILFLVAKPRFLQCFLDSSSFAVSNYVGSRVGDLATRDFAEKKILEFPLPLLALDALSGVVLGISGSACLELLVNECFWKGLSSIVLSLTKWFSQKGCSDNILPQPLPNSSSSVTQTVFNRKCILS